MAKCLDGLEFVQISKPGERGTLLMQVRYPHIIGRLVFIGQKQPDEIEPLMRSLANGDVLAKVTGYSIFVLPGGTLDCTSVEPEKMKDVLNDMASFTLNEIIPLKMERYNSNKEGAIVVSMPSKAQSRYYNEIRKARRAAKLAQDED